MQFFIYIGEKTTAHSSPTPLKRRIKIYRYVKNSLNGGIFLSSKRLLFVAYLYKAGERLLLHADVSLYISVRSLQTKKFRDTYIHANKINKIKQLSIFLMVVIKNIIMMPPVFCMKSLIT